jgi:hypothetical protein
MNTRPTPETDELVRTQLERVGITSQVLASKLTLKCESLERERDEARIELEKYTTDSEDDALYNVRRLRKELTAVTEQRDEAQEQLAKIEIVMRAELGGHPDSELWGEAGLIAATMRCVDALGEVTEQRDEAREALRDMLSGWRYIRQVHGDLYGVGWDRSQTKAEKALEDAK